MPHFRIAPGVKTCLLSDPSRGLHTMAIERSLILLKPDCLDGHHAGEVIGRFEKAGFEIRAPSSSH